MDAFNSFVVSFCTGCVVFGVLFILCPVGSMTQSVKYIFCLCFVCCVIGSATTLSEPDFSYFDKNNKDEILSEQNAAVTAQMVFCEALNQQNINYRKIVVDTNKTANGGIIIDKVTVYTSESELRILAAIGSDGYEVSVVNE